MGDVVDYTKVPQAPYKSVRDIGFCEEQNRRHRRTMEDGHCMIDGFRGNEGEGYFAIYDGHGGKGAVLKVQKEFHNVIETYLNDNDENVPEAFNGAYGFMDGELATQDFMHCGTTSITCLVRKESTGRKLYVANCGDARVVINEGGVARRLTVDHKCGEQEEDDRIRQTGGCILRGRVSGILAVSRALGDHAMKDWVISTPYQEQVDLEDKHTQLILACDGVWDVLSDQEVVDLIKEGESTAQEMADKILRTSLEKGSKDNISVMVVLL
ncbi:protein phosphatase PTC1 [Acrasis kona]|uniref:Protein phosphatase PTC1 n=1 Tax=Acrasis kona TaxID=1008807 RepID=A0AAW2ZPS9_9EUKA